MTFNPKNEKKNVALLNNHNVLSCHVVEYVVQGVTAISGKRFKLIFLVLIYVVLKQTIYQQKALDLSFNLAP